MSQIIDFQLRIGDLVKIVTWHSDAPTADETGFVTLTHHPSNAMHHSPVAIGKMHAKQLGIILEIDEKIDYVKIAAGGTIGWARKKRIHKIT